MIINNTQITELHDIALIASSSILSFIVFVLLEPFFTKQLIKLKIGKQIRENAISGEKSTIFSQLHAKKKGTPTMGGILIWGSIFIVVIISRILSAMGITDHSLLNRKETWIPLFTLLSFGILGAIDDYFNIKGIGKTKGLSAKIKIIWLTILSLMGGIWFNQKLGFDHISIPIPGIEALHVGWFYIIIFVVVIIATANAVNFTDGLDGLASGLLILAFGSFGIIAYMKGMLILSALCGVIAGANVAFLWFNVPPARFYMGDTGSLALGATLGVIAMLTEQTLILPIIGFIFVVEAVSVILQLTWKKFFKRKLFSIAPIHHHFEKKGWAEFTVVMRFWIIGGIFTTIGTIIALFNLS